MTVKWKPNLGQLLGAGLIVISGGAMLYQLSRGDVVVTFHTPAEVFEGVEEFKAKNFRVSGLVLPGTISWRADTRDLEFRMSDLKGHEFVVTYLGSPPDLFKEARGVIVEGRLTSDPIVTPGGTRSMQLRASQLLVKHEEVYDTKQDHSKLKQARLLDSLNMPK